MAVTIHLNGKSNSLVHKGSMGIAKSTIPDVCKTPTPGGPVPIPYPVIVSMSSDLKKGTKKIKVDGGKSAAVKGSEFSRCTGDEPGTVGGVKSSTNMKEATWILYSFDVKLEGKNACRLSDKMLMNHGNTACLSGVNNPPVYGGDSACTICGAPEGHPIPNSDESALEAQNQVANAPPAFRKNGKQKGFMVSSIVCVTSTGAKVVFSQASPGGVAAGFKSNPTSIPGKPKTAGGRAIKPADYTRKGSNKGGQCAGAKVILAANAAGLKPVAMTEIWSGPSNSNFSEGKHAESCETCKQLLSDLLCDQPPD